MVMYLMYISIIEGLETACGAVHRRGEEAFAGGAEVRHDARRLRRLQPHAPHRAFGAEQWAARWTL